MTDGQPHAEEPLDGRAWGEWINADARKWDSVRRSYDVFAANTGELLEVVRAPERDQSLALRLLAMADPPFMQAYWAAVDQRLHNQLAAAVSLVDQTRVLTDFYGEWNPHFAEEWATRTSEMRDDPRTHFLRRLRNYLLHVGGAPMASRTDLATLQMTVALSREGLLASSFEWSPKAKEFLQAAPGNIPLGSVVEEYAQEMSSAYVWLLDQRVKVMNDPATLAHLPRWRGGTPGDG